MAKHYHLYTDELGEFSPKRYKKSPLFIVTGCIVEVDDVIRVKHMLDLIKYKYWNKTSIILHSKNIGKKEKDFLIFKGDVARFNEFTKDLCGIISSSSSSILGVILDQKLSFKKGWGPEKVIREVYGAVIKNYIRILIQKKASGTIIQEASTSFQDIKIYEKFFEYQSVGLIREGIIHKEVKDRLTSISFATKKDNSSLTEIADILGYGLYLNYMISQKKINEESLNKYQVMIKKLAKFKVTNVKYKNFKDVEVIKP